MTSLIEPGRLFSQHSLNTYLRCPKRFLLKYIERQPWPMPEEEDPLGYQEHLARGRVFHQWLARDQLGMDMGPIVAASEDPQLQRWWEAWRAFERDALPRQIREVELPIVVPLGAYRLYARYDLVAVDPGGEAVIVDWKTLEEVPRLETLQGRVQTRVYLYTLVAAGHVLTGGRPVEPAQATMLYWFANHPKEHAAIPYSRQAYARDGEWLSRLVQEIAGKEREGFLRTEDRRFCARCNYRSYCDRLDEGPVARAQDWLDEDIDFDLDLEEVP
ncbi:MAG: PD-(D/E)XK nuclease family protein, partial [Chloroflexi bacterium]|nr:PD-(D/E)XK nuclease family protein [Chloroflexota bacterium]